MPDISIGGLYQHWKGDHYIALRTVLGVPDPSTISFIGGLDLICQHESMGILASPEIAVDGNIYLVAVNPQYQVELMGEYVIYTGVSSSKYWFRHSGDWSEEMIVDPRDPESKTAPRFRKI